MGSIGRFDLYLIAGEAKTGSGKRTVIRIATKPHFGAKWSQKTTKSAISDQKPQSGT